MNTRTLFLGLATIGIGACNSSQPAHEASTAQTPVAAPAPAQPPTVAKSQNVSPSQFAAVRKDHPEYVLLDVRTPSEYAAGHLDGARLVDFRSPDFDQQVASLDPSKTYLVYCRTGHRSGQACQKLAAAGMNTYNLDGGITAWQQAQLPLQKP